MARTTLPRRDLFGATAAFLLLAAPEAGAAKAEEIDGDLIRLCREFVANEKEYARLVSLGANIIGPNPYNEPLRRISDRNGEVYEAICAIRALTPEGLRAKAEALLWWFEKDIDGEPLRDEEWLAASLVEDILGRQMTVAPMARRADYTAEPDGELLRLCDEFHRRNAIAHGMSGDPWSALDDAMAARWEVSDCIEDLRPTTEAGRRAKAAVALVLLREQRGDDPADADARFAMAALRDVAEEV